jgi:hypothetical protein
MHSKEALVADLKQKIAHLQQKIHSIPTAGAENAVFRFVTVGMSHMDVSQIRMFRAEIAGHAGMEKVLTLIDGHLALREILADTEG